jgi:hypothetical protein
MCPGIAPDSISTPQVATLAPARPVLGVSYTDAPLGM